jgi:hypothetical protein
MHSPESKLISRYVALTAAQTLEYFRYWREYGKLFNRITEEASDVRVVVLSSSLPKLFTAGLDRRFTNISASTLSNFFKTRSGRSQ